MAARTPSPHNPTVTANGYTVSWLPEGDIDGYVWAITVEYRGRDLWAVKHSGFCLGRDGSWEWESSPGNREDEWLAEHRFPLAEALERAKGALPELKVNGLKATDLLAWREGGRES